MADPFVSHSQQLFQTTTKMDEPDRNAARGTGLDGSDELFAVFQQVVSDAVLKSTRSGVRVVPERLIEIIRTMPTDVQGTVTRALA
jgi:hypothetical protein